MSYKTLLMLSAAAFLALPLQGAEIQGVVRQVNGKTAGITVEGDQLPGTGDKADIFFKLAGVDDEISVATGSVIKVERDSVQVKIESSTGDVAQNQLVRIKSEAPQPRRATVSGTPSPIGTVADNNSSKASAEAIAASLQGKWFGQLRSQPVIVQGDGSVIVPLPKPGASLSGSYVVDAAAKPPRIEISDFKWIPSPNFTDEELAAFHQETKAIEGVFKVFDGTIIAEIDNPTRVRAKFFTKDQAAAKPKVEEPDVFVFDKEGSEAFQAILKFTETYTTLSREAAARVEKKDYDGAIAVYIRLLEVEPDNIWAFFGRARVYQLKRDWAKALEDLNRHLSQNPGGGFAYLERARVRIRMGRWTPEVLEDCNKAIVLSQHNGEPYLFRAGYFQNTGDMGAAETDYKKAVSLNPGLESSVREMKAGTFGKEKKPGGTQ